MGPYRFVRAVAPCLLLAASWPLIAAGPLKADLPEFNPKTMGGQYFWADELVYYDWRIQCNTFTGHCRLLDDEKHRHAYGTFEHCNAKLAEIKRQKGLPPMKGKVVLVLGGLGDPRHIPERMAKYFATRAVTWLPALLTRAFSTTLADTPNRWTAWSGTWMASRRSTSWATAWAIW